MRRRKRRRAASAFSFSFLDVFACTLGGLIFILVACALQGQGVTRAVAEAMHREISSLEVSLEELEERARRAEEERDTRAFERDGMRRSVERNQVLVAKLEDQLSQAQAREEAASAREGELAYTWGRLPDSVGSQVPVYLECRGDKVWVQPAGPAEDEQRLGSPQSEVRQVLRSLRGDRRRYAVLVLRPGGFRVYHRVAAILDELGLEFGRDAIAGSVRIEGWRQ